MGNTVYDWAPFFQAINNATTQWGQRNQYQGMLDKLVGQGTPTPQQTQLPAQTAQMPSMQPPGGVTIGGGQMAVNQSPLSITPPAINGSYGPGAPMSYNGPAGQMLGAGASSILPLLRNAPPSVGLPLLLNLATKNAERQQNIADKKITPMTDAEARAANLRPGGVYGRDVSGNIVPIQESDLMSDSALKQKYDVLRQQGLIAAEAPLTKMQTGTLAHEAAQLAETKRHDTQTEFAALHPFGVQGGDQTKTGSDFLTSLSPGMAAQIKAIGDYRQAPPANRATKEGIALMTMVNQYNPSYDATQYGSKVKARNDFTTGKNGNTVRSLNVAVQHLDQLGQLSDAMANGDIQAVNKIANIFATQTGQPAPSNFNAAKQIVGDEIVKAIVGSGGGVSDREEAAHNISAASSPQQLAGVIKTYQGLLGGQLKGLKQQYEKSTGLNDFEDYLAPETRTRLEKNSQADAAPVTKTISGKAYVQRDGKWYEQ